MSGTLIRLTQTNFQVNCLHLRWLSSGRGSNSFFSNIVQNLKQEFKKNSELQESIKKFREEKARLEESDALLNARKKYKTIENETEKSVKSAFDNISSQVKDGLDDLKQTEFGKRTSDFAGGVSDTARAASESFAKGGERLVQSEAFKKVSEGVDTVRQSIDEELSRAEIYRSPQVLLRRSDYRIIKDPEREIEANESETGVDLHKDSYWYQRWQRFKDSNPAVNKMFDINTQIQESDHAVAQSVRFLRNTASRVFGSIFSSTKISETMTEIQKREPSFTQISFVKMCHHKVLPNVIEAFYRADLNILEDWCSTVAYSKISADIKQFIQTGHRFVSTVLDITEPDIVNAAIENGLPSVVITFQVQAIFSIKDKHGAMITGPAAESLCGEEDKVQRYYWVLVMVKDIDELDPIASWRVGDMHMQKLALAF